MANSVSQTLSINDTGVGMGLFNLVGIVSGAVGTAMVGKILEGRWLDFSLVSRSARPSAYAYSNLMLLFALIVAAGGALYLIKAIATSGREVFDAGTGPKPAWGLNGARIFEPIGHNAPCGDSADLSSFSPLEETMRRSEINGRIAEAEAFFDAMLFRLPPWAFRGPGDWKESRGNDTEIVENMLGWDLTDFGSGDFDRVGLLLFTLRNGNPKRDQKKYAEKIMIVGEGQETPLHFHWSKMEDIIVRGGGNLVVQLWASTADEGLSGERLSLRVDGSSREVDAGASITLRPGESVCLEPRVYHRFFGEAGKGRVLVGEVSAVNDDSADNRFYAPAGRFPAIEEDEAPLRLLAADYGRYLR
jgi:D-lyxose ketol-isomerase